MKTKSDMLVILSVIAVVIAAIVSVGGVDLWLAGTQWILVGIVLGVYALYAKDRG